MKRLRTLVDRDAMTFAAVIVFVVMGYNRSPLWVAIAGGALFGVPSMVDLILLKNRHVRMPADWRALTIYLQALGQGIGAGLAGFFMGLGFRTYWDL
jgi:hypothetical protein